MSYKELYFSLFNAISDAIEEMETQNFGHAKVRLIQAQQDAEERYMEAEGQDLLETDIWKQEPSYLASLIEMEEKMRHVLFLMEQGKYKEAGDTAERVLNRVNTGRSTAEI